MKKFLCILFIGVISTGYLSLSQAQTKIYRLNLTIADQYNHPLTDSIHFSFRNSDSSTTSNNPYTSTSQYADVSSVYDSGNVATNYTDSMITIQYKACGQWYTLDTFFHTFHSSWASVWYLSMQIKAPCVNPCHADFYHGISANYLRISGTPHILSGPFKYHWYMGDGQESFSQNLNYTYSVPGTYTLSLVILDTLNSCTDSVAKTVNVFPQCSPVFYANHSKYGHVDVLVGNNAVPGYTHTWVIGDSIFTNNGTNFSYRFGAGGFKPIKYIVEYPGYCKDSLTKSVNASSCYTEVGGHQVNFRTVTIQPINSIDTFRYSFGDGASVIARGPVSHTYAVNKSYRIEVKDLHKYCFMTDLYITINSDCSNNFGSQVDSQFKMTFFVTQSVNLNVRRRIYPSGDTLYGDSVSYVFPARGQYSIFHEFLDSSGSIACSHYDYTFVNSCGLFGWQYWNDMIHGSVRFGSSTSQYDSLMVYLIEYDSVAATLTGVDSTVLYSSTNDTGYFTFDELCDSAKVYMVKAALLPGSGMYANYLPTYYNQSASWSGATKLKPYTHIMLDMLAGTNPGGPGFIGGYISQGANKKFNPLEGIQVNLFDDNNTPLAFDLSDANGYYEFPSLPFGTYRVTVEIMGKTSDSYMITLSATNERAEDQDFEVNNTYVSTLNTAVHRPQFNGKIYPNPAKEQLIIEWNEQADTEITLQFYSVHGQLIAQFDLKRNNETTSFIHVKDLPRGIYMMQIHDGNNQSMHRIQLD